MAVCSWQTRKHGQGSLNVELKIENGGKIGS